MGVVVRGGQIAHYPGTGPEQAVASLPPLMFCRVDPFARPLLGTRFGVLPLGLN